MEKPVFYNADIGDETDRWVYSRDLDENGDPVGVIIPDLAAEHARLLAHLNAVGTYGGADFDEAEILATVDRLRAIEEFLPAKSIARPIAASDLAEDVPF